MKTNNPFQMLATGLFLATTLLTFAPQARGQVFVSDFSTSTIRQYTTAGVGSTFASTGPISPMGIAFGADGFLYVANYADNTIWRFDNNGNGTIFAGVHNDYTQGLAGPVGLAFDSTGTTLYVANHVSQASAYSITSYSTAGSGLHTGTPFATTSFGSGTGLNKPTGLAIYGGNLYVANEGNNLVVKYALPGGGGSPVTFASTGLNNPWGLAFDNLGNLYVANQSGQNISKYDSSGASLGVFASGLANSPCGLAFDSTFSNLYEAENGSTIRKVTNGVVSIFAFTEGLVTPQFIAIKPDCAPATLTAAVYAGLTITGTIGCKYRIDYTTSLTTPVTWTTLTTITLPTSPYFYVDTTPASNSRFYQAVPVS